MKDDNSIFGKRPEKLDRMLHLGLHETKDPEPIPPAGPDGFRRAALRIAA